MPKIAKDRILEKCKGCNRRLLVKPESGYCLVCENGALKERIALLEFQLEQKNKQLRIQSGGINERSDKKQQ